MGLQRSWSLFAYTQTLYQRVIGEQIKGIAHGHFIMILLNLTRGVHMREVLSR